MPPNVSFDFFGINQLQRQLLKRYILDSAYKVVPQFQQ